MSKSTGLKELFRTLDIIYKTDYKCERTVRRIIKRLAIEGIVFVPSKIGAGVYVRKEHASEKEIKRYQHSEASRSKSHYYDTVVPINHVRKDLVNQMNHEGRLEGTANEIYNIPR